MEEKKDYSKYEPLRLDSCTVVTDVDKFLKSHRAMVKSFGDKRIAKPYLERGKLAILRMKEIDKKEKTENKK